jgi:phosphatidylserine/phosphatidylglycerophosphate/cardiolipin synthase-like enzyme
MTTIERPPAALFSTGTSSAFVGNADFHRCLCDLIDAAESEIADYVVPETRPDEHDRHILEAFGNANRRGIACRTLVSAEHLHLVQFTWRPDFDMRTFLQKVPHIRLVEKVNGPFTVIDRRKVLLNLPSPSDPGEYTTSVVVDDPRLAEHLLASFDRMWDEAALRQEDLLAAWEGRGASR